MIAPLDRIRADQERWAEPPQPPATETALADLVRRARRDLGRPVPEPYLDLLRAQDGVNVNGLLLYGTRTAVAVATPTATILGLVEANLAWYGHEHLLVVGDGNLDVYAYDPAAGDWLAVDRVATDHTRFHTFDGLLHAALDAHR